MVNQICINCKTGAESCKLDPKSVMCPYMHFHTGKSCPLYVPYVSNEESEVKEVERV